MINLDIECFVTLGKAATIGLRAFSRLISHIVVLSRQFTAYQLCLINFCITRILYHFWSLHRIARIINLRLGRLYVLVLRRCRSFSNDQKILGCLILHCYWRFELFRRYLSVRLSINSVSKVSRHLIIIRGFYSDVIMLIQLLTFNCHLLLRRELLNDTRLS